MLGVELRTSGWPSTRVAAGVTAIGAGNHSTRFWGASATKSPLAGSTPTPGTVLGMQVLETLVQERTWLYDAWPRTPSAFWSPPAASGVWYPSTRLLPSSAT